MNPKSKQRMPGYPREKVKIRFAFNPGKRITTKQFLKGILPALWDEADREQVIATADHYVNLFNETPGFFYPFPIDRNKTRLIDIHVGHFGHYPWDVVEADIYPLCQTCWNWDGYRRTGVMFTFLAPDGEAFLCPACGNVVIEDPGAEKAGVTHFLTRKEYKVRYGVEAPVAEH